MSSRAVTRVFQGVEEQIATDQLKDGEKLDEASLAERFHAVRWEQTDAFLNAALDASLALAFIIAAAESIDRHMSNIEGPRIK